MRVIGLVLALILTLASLAAEGQQAPRIAKIGLLTPSTPAVAAPLVEALRQGLRELGHVDGKTFVLAVRHGEGKLERFPDLARELVALKPDVIVVSTDAAIAAVRRETRTIPIVMANSTDPVGTGFVASLARPGGNVTGLSNLSAELSGKRLELLRELVPGISRVAFLWDPDVRGNLVEYRETEAAARTLRLELHSIECASAEDLDRAFSAVTSERAQALILPGGNPVGFTNRSRIVSFAQRNRLPTMFAVREYVDAGGLMSYGPSIPDRYRRSATYVDKILKGAKAGELPVEQPTKFQLVISLKTAKAIGLTIPQALLGRADEVIR
jgi:putative ABC transport system substrate-binding protein